MTLKPPAELDALLQTTIGQHGYWLANNVEHIRSELERGLTHYGLADMVRKLDDWQSNYVQQLYAKIEEARK